MKVIRQLNLEKKEKIGDRGVKLSNSHETIKKYSENIYTYNQKIFKKHVRRRFIITKQLLQLFDQSIHIFEGIFLY